MDDVSAQDLRGAAFASNLRQAFGAPVRDELPLRFKALLDRLGECDLAPPPPKAGPGWPVA